MKDMSLSGSFEASSLTEAAAVRDEGGEAKLKLRRPQERRPAEQDLAPVDVREIRKEYASVLAESESGRIPPRRRSRRLRDYIILMVLGNLALAGGAVLGGSLVSLVFGLSGCLLFSIGTTWVMWMVLDGY